MRHRPGTRKRSRGAAAHHGPLLHHRAPAHHYPTGVVMTAERRGALIAWARERGALIVEDDYDVEYRFGRDPVASLQGLVPDLVAFVATTSKTLAPALRLADGV